MKLEDGYGDLDDGQSMQEEEFEVERRETLDNFTAGKQFVRGCLRGAQKVEVNDGR